MKKFLLFCAAAATAASMSATSYEVFNIENPGTWAASAATEGFVQNQKFGDKTFSITTLKESSTNALLSPDNNTYAWRVYKNSSVKFDFGGVKMVKMVITYDSMNSGQYCVEAVLSDGWSGAVAEDLYTLTSAGSVDLTMTYSNGQGRIKKVVVTDEAGETEPLTPTFDTPDDPGTPDEPTPDTPEGVIFQTAFDSNLDGWTKLNDESLSDFNGWKINANPVCAICNSYYSGENHAADCWLYREFDCTEYKNVALTFEQAFGFDFPSAQVENYTVNVREAGTTEWYPLAMANFPEVPAKNWSDWVSNSFDLSEYDGSKIEIGFRYLTDGSKSRAWELKNFVLSGDKTGGVNAIEADNATAVYYNLQGVRVAQPENGLYIVVKNNKAVKVIL